MGKIKKKYTSGEASQYLSKRKAERSLQISDREFRRLCVFTGIHPIEPKHKKRVGKGSTFPQQYFSKKDVQHIGQNPIINILRKKRIYYRKLNHAHERKDTEVIQRLETNMPDETYYIDHILYERYPTPLDALNDLDDCLNFIFMFSCLPSMTGVSHETMELCRSLAVEFLNYVIVTRSVKKAFASIKGFYLQAEIHNTPVRWLMIRDLVHKAPTNIEFGLEKMYCDLYVRMLEFVLVWLYKEKNLYYPPKLTKTDVAPEMNYEFLASLNQPLGYKSKSSHENVEGMLEGGNYAEAEEKMLKTHLDMQQTDGGTLVDDVQGRAAEERLRNLAKARLFSNMKVFLGRETPRQVLCIIIRSGGGLVSWPETCGPGCNFPQDDPEIKYEIVDRPMKPEKMRLDRKYVQPQWVFDSLNAGQLLPIGQYVPGAHPPAHYCPFISKDLPSEDEDEEEENEESERENNKESDEGIAEDDEEDEEEEGEEDEEEEEEEEDSDESEMEVEESNVSKKKQKTDISKSSKKKDSIVPGKVPTKRQLKNLETKKANEQKRLREAMLPKKHRELYKKMCHSIKRSKKDVEKLKTKRKNARSKNKK